MKFSSYTLLRVAEIIYLSSQALVLACEGDCIIGVVDAFLGNYTAPMATALNEIAISIVSEIVHNEDNPATYYISPIIEEYNKRAYDFMENAIFKTNFHGKCLDPNTKLEPAGCPNPDCPLICGTPGSLVHFYDRLRYIAFNGTVGLYNSIVKLNSETFRKVEQRVAEAASSNERRRYLRFMPYELARQKAGLFREIDSREVDIRAEERINHNLQAILRRFRDALGFVCGGNANESDVGLPDCSWEFAMKEYILSFP